MGHCHVEKRQCFGHPFQVLDGSQRKFCGADWLSPALVYRTWPQVEEGYRSSSIEKPSFPLLQLFVPIPVVHVLWPKLTVRHFKCLLAHDTNLHVSPPRSNMAVPRTSLRGFLAHAKGVLGEAIDYGQKITFVIGNESAGEHDSGSTRARSVLMQSRS